MVFAVVLLIFAYITAVLFSIAIIVRDRTVARVGRARGIDSRTRIRWCRVVSIRRAIIIRFSLFASITHILRTIALSVVLHIAWALSLQHGFVFAVSLGAPTSFSPMYTYHHRPHQLHGKPFRTP